MTRKDYVALADGIGRALGRSITEHGEYSEAMRGVEYVMVEIIGVLRADNSRFDVSRFSAAVAEAASVR